MAHRVPHAPPASVPGYGHPRRAVRPRPDRTARRAQTVASTRTDLHRSPLGDCCGPGCHRRCSWVCWGYVADFGELRSMPSPLAATWRCGMAPTPAKRSGREARSLPKAEPSLTTCAALSNFASASRVWRWSIPAWCPSRTGGRTLSASARWSRSTLTELWRASRSAAAQLRSLEAWMRARGVREC